jgi:hypothetical protein
MAERSIPNREVAVSIPARRAESPFHTPFSGVPKGRESNGAFLLTTFVRYGLVVAVVPGNFSVKMTSPLPRSIFTPPLSKPLGPML